MSHVDDGTLHAFLDGALAPAAAQGVAAHVAHCPSCRTRLEEEQALIARADELLGLAAPPERDLPPLRAGDRRPPARLWWQVRLPLAWAATVVLALGIGLRLGELATPIGGSRAPTDSDLAAGRALPARHTPESSRVATRVGARAAARPQATEPPAAPAPTPSPAPTVTEEADRVGRQSAALRAVEPETALARARAEVAPAAAERNVVADKAAGPGVTAVVGLEKLGDGPRGSPVSLDSARALLGSDPLAVPGLPIRGVYHARLPGYATAVIVEQALDSSVTIAVINARPAARAFAAQRPSPAPLARAPLSADSSGISRLVVEVRGPLTADSLAALQHLLRPLRR